jgi:hypothetical protein
LSGKRKEEVGIGSGRGIVQTLHGPYAGRAERARSEYERGIERATERETERTIERVTERVAAGAAAGTAAGAVRSGFVRGYEPLPGIEQAAAERGRADESGSLGSAAAAAGEVGEAGDGGIALARRCEPLP